MKALLSGFFLLCATLLSAQDLRPFTGDDIPGLQLVKMDTFGLEGFIRFRRAYADICREYGLKRVWIFDYTLNGEEAVLEVYGMNDAPAAFGLYSLAADSCRMRGMLTAMSCLGPDRMMAAHGLYFIRAYTKGNTARGQQLHATLVQQFMSRYPQDSWFFPAIFKKEQLSSYTRTLKYTVGPVSLNRGVPQLNDLLKDMSFQCYTMVIRNRDYSGILARITFPQFGMLDDFLMRAGMSLTENPEPVMATGGTYRSWYKINDTHIIYLECSSPDVKLSEMLPEKPDINTWSIDH